MKTQHLLSGILAIFLLSGYVLGQSGWTDDGSVVRLTDSTDNVGIGTDDPDYKLHVHSTTGNANAQVKSTYGTADLILDAAEGSQPRVFFRQGGAASDFVIGVDGGDSDKFKIGTTSLGNNTRLTINASGNVGIGTSSPGWPLEINGSIALPYTSGIRASNWVDGKNLILKCGWTAGVGNWTGLYVPDNAVEVQHVTIVNTGNVGIGTSNPQSKLAVNGTITAKEVEVTLTGWPDHVFADNYSLMPLREVEKYIHANRHLPDMPSAADVVENGVSLGGMQAKLLQKVEELTLYVIDLKKENEALKERVAEMEQ